METKFRTKREVLVAALRIRGEKGATVADLRSLGIAHPANMVKRLRRDGWRILTVSKYDQGNHHGARCYRLESRGGEGPSCNET